MIALSLPARAEAEQPFVARLSTRTSTDHHTLSLVEGQPLLAAYTGLNGLVVMEGADYADLDGDVILVDPNSSRAERLFRRDSRHNTLLVTERCDQLCVMCSQPPKKTHNDRFRYFEQACMLADDNVVIGITGGEPLLYKDQVLGMIERVLARRPNVKFHVLTNGQHFDASDAERLAQPNFRRLQWGIPLYSPNAAEHDAVVGKTGAFERLEDSMATLACAGASIELRTVVLTTNVRKLPDLAAHIARRLPFIASWSVMQLENIGFARNRWRLLRFDHSLDFGPIAEALDLAASRGMAAQLFNFPRCTVPLAYRDYAVASISDWKQRFGSACGTCTQKSRCSGFFEWHPTDEIEAKASPL